MGHAIQLDHGLVVAAAWMRAIDAQDPLVVVTCDVVGNIRAALLALVCWPVHRRAVVPFYLDSIHASNTARHAQNSKNIGCLFGGLPRLVRRDRILVVLANKPPNESEKQRGSRMGMHGIM